MMRGWLVWVRFWRTPLPQPVQWPLIWQRGKYYSVEDWHV